MPHHVFTRQALYDRVWAEPIRILAPLLGVSDVGLAKVCRAAGIPTERGLLTATDGDETLPFALYERGKIVHRPATEDGGVRLKRVAEGCGGQAEAVLNWRANLAAQGFAVACGLK